MTYKFKLNKKLTDTKVNIRCQRAEIDDVISILEKEFKASDDKEDRADLNCAINHFNSNVKFYLEKAVEGIRYYQEGKVYKR